jgi:hypothetical protein
MMTSNPQPDLGGFFAALGSLRNVPPTLLQLIESLPELLDVTRRFASEESVVGLIDLQREAGRLLAHVDGAEGKGPRFALPGHRPLVAGPRAAVYLVVPGAQLNGQTGQAALVFATIERAGSHGKTKQELREELELKDKSVESVLYRLRLQGAIQAFNAIDVRSDGVSK